MKRGNYWILVTVLGICLVGLLAIRLHAGWILTGNKEVLSGIKNFELELIMDPAEKTAHGLKYEEVDKNIKLAFGAYGIKVFSLLDWNSETGRYKNRPFREHSDLSMSKETAVLHIRIDGVWPLTIIDGERWYSYRIQISILQYARLSRNSKIHFQAITWEDSQMSICTEDMFALEVESALDKRLDYLIKDYLAANQKEEPTKEGEKPKGN